MTLEKATKSAGRGSPRRQDGEDDTKDDDDEEVQKEDEDERTSPCASNSTVSTRRAILEFRWDPEKYTNDSFLGKRRRSEGPRISILMDVNHL